MDFGFDDRFIGPLYNLLQHFTNHYLWLDTLDFWPHYTNPLLLQLNFQSRVKVTLQLTVSQSVSLGVEPHLGLMTRYLLLFDSYGLVFVGHPFWWEDRSVFCICYWSLPAQSFLGLSPLRLATIFYCLRFETSLFIASYHSQGHSGGIPPRLHMASYYVASGWTTQKTHPLPGNRYPLLLHIYCCRMCLLSCA
jgi:hypothetical protein